MDRETKEVPSLEALQRKLDAARGREASEASGSSPAGDAMHVALDLVSGVVVGGTIGYLLDTWLGTMPLFLILCLFIGLAAGVKLMMRTAAKLSQELETQAGQASDQPSAPLERGTETRD